MDTHQQNCLAAKSAYEASVCQQQKASQASEASIEGENPGVAAIRARLTVAEFNLVETVVRASTDGCVTQVALRSGMMAAPLPLKPVMVLVHEEQKFFIAAFRQN